MATRRYDMRIPTAIKVTVRGTDRNGNPFEQTANTINVSRTGARLEGIGCVEGAETVEVRRGWFRKAKFRVVWAGRPGTPEAGQVGLRQVEHDATFWGIPFPTGAVTSDYKPATAAASAVPASGPIPMDWSAPPARSKAAAEPQVPYMGPTIEDTNVVGLTWEKPSSSTRTIRERVASVTVRWTDASGMQREESCPAARVLRDKSCIVPMKAALKEGTEVTIINARTKSSRVASVSMCGPQLPDNSYPIAIDLPAPDTTFWGSGSVH